MVLYCGQEMQVSNGWHHCMKYYKRLIEIPHNKETNTIAKLFVDYVDEYNPFWEELRETLHELWRQGHYEGYEPKVTDKWRI